MTRFNTHDRTPRPKSSPLTVVLLVTVYLCFLFIFLIPALLCFFGTNNIPAGMLALLFWLVMALLLPMSPLDLHRAYIEIEDDRIQVVDYVCYFRKCRTVSTSDIARAEVLHTAARRFHGLRSPHSGSRYIHFWDRHEKYLFKVMETPENTKFFEAYLNPPTATDK